MDNISTTFIYHNPLLEDYLKKMLDNPEYKKTLDSYTEEVYRASDTGRSYRTINSWDSAGMLITLPNRDSKWRKYSLVEIIWIYTIRELRSIGFSKRKILKLKDCIFPTLPNSNITDTRRFKQYIFSVVAKRDVYLIVKPDGEGDLAIDIELIETERKNPEFPYTYTMISINKLCAEFTGNKDYIKKNQFLYIPLKKELELLNEVKNNETLKEVTITVKGNKITRADYKSPKNTKQVTSVLNEALAKGGDGELHIKWQKGSIVYTEEVEKN